MGSMRQRAISCFLAEMIDGEPTLRRYELTLHLLRKPAFDRGAQPYQHVNIPVRLRNELIHYKSKWGQEMDKERLFSSLEQPRFDKPLFMSPHTNFFPHRCLLASWSVTTAFGFIEAFYRRLGVSSPLASHSAYFRVPGVRLRS